MAWKGELGVQIALETQKRGETETETEMRGIKKEWFRLPICLFS